MSPFEEEDRVPHSCPIPGIWWYLPSSVNECRRLVLAYDNKPLIALK